MAVTATAHPTHIASTVLHPVLDLGVAASPSDPIPVPSSAPSSPSSSSSYDLAVSSHEPVLSRSPSIDGRNYSAGPSSSRASHPSSTTAAPRSMSISAGNTSSKPGTSSPAHPKRHPRLGVFGSGSGSGGAPNAPERHTVGLKGKAKEAPVAAERDAVWDQGTFGRAEWEPTCRSRRSRKRHGGAPSFSLASSAGAASSSSPSPNMSQEHDDHDIFFSPDPSTDMATFSTDTVTDRIYPGSIAVAGADAVQSPASFVSFSSSAADMTFHSPMTSPLISPRQVVSPSSYFPLFSEANNNPVPFMLPQSEAVVDEEMSIPSQPAIPYRRSSFGYAAPPCSSVRGVRLSWANTVTSLAGVVNTIQAPPQPDPPTTPPGKPATVRPRSSSGGDRRERRAGRRPSHDSTTLIAPSSDSHSSRPGRRAPPSPTDAVDIPPRWSSSPKLRLSSISTSPKVRFQEDEKHRQSPSDKQFEPPTSSEAPEGLGLSGIDAHVFPPSRREAVAKGLGPASGGVSERPPLPPPPIVSVPSPPSADDPVRIEGVDPPHPAQVDTEDGHEPARTLSPRPSLIIVPDGSPTAAKPDGPDCNIGSLRVVEADDCKISKFTAAATESGDRSHILAERVVPPRATASAGLPRPVAVDGAPLLMEPLSTGTSSASGSGCGSSSCDGSVRYQRPSISEEEQDQEAITEETTAGQKGSSALSHGGRRLFHVGETEDEEERREAEAEAQRKKAEKMRQKRFHSFLELVETERRYVEDLSVLVFVYFENASTLPFFIEHPTKLAILARNAHSLVDLHQRLADDFSRILDEYDLSQFTTEPPTMIQCHPGKADTAVAKVARRFVEEARSYALYDEFCAKHNEALAILREAESRQSDWDVFERHCATVIQAAQRTGAGPEPLLPVSPTTVHPPTPPASKQRLPVSIPSSPRGGPTAKARHGPASKLHLRDYLIKPIQRLCLYPLVLQSLLRNTPDFVELDYHTARSHGWVSDNGRGDLEMAVEAMKGVADRVDEAKREREQQIRSATILERLEPNPGLPTAFLEDLGDCVLAGSLDVLYHNVRSAPLVAPLRFKYYGCFLYSTFLLMVKVRKSKSFESRHWFPLAFFELSNLSNGDGLLPYSFRLSHLDHHFEFAAANSKERDVWVEHIQIALEKARVSWNGTGLMGIEAIHGPSRNSSFAAQTRRMSAPVEDLMEPSLRRSLSFKRNSVPAVSADMDRLAPLLSGMGYVHEPDSSPVETPSPVDPLWTFFSESVTVEAGPDQAPVSNIVIRHASASQRTVVDRGLQDVFSDACLAARNSVDTGSVTESCSTTWQTSAPSIGSKMKLSSVQTVKLQRRRSALDLLHPSGDDGSHRVVVEPHSASVTHSRSNSASSPDAFFGNYAIGGSDSPYVAPTGTTRIPVQATQNDAHGSSSQQPWSSLFGTRRRTRSNAALASPFTLDRGWPANEPIAPHVMPVGGAHPHERRLYGGSETPGPPPNCDLNRSNSVTAVHNGGGLTRTESFRRALSTSLRANRSRSVPRVSQAVDGGERQARQQRPDGQQPIAAAVAVAASTAEAVEESAPRRPARTEPPSPEMTPVRSLSGLLRHKSLGQPPAGWLQRRLSTISATPREERETNGRHAPPQRSPPMPKRGLPLSSSSSSSSSNPSSPTKAAAKVDCGDVPSNQPAPASKGFRYGCSGSVYMDVSASEPVHIAAERPHPLPTQRAAESAQILTTGLPAGDPDDGYAQAAAAAARRKKGSHRLFANLNRLTAIPGLTTSPPTSPPAFGLGGRKKSQ